jgi:hypothetical protein
MLIGSNPGTIMKMISQDQYFDRRIFSRLLQSDFYCVSEEELWRVVKDRNLQAEMKFCRYECMNQDFLFSQVLSHLPKEILIELYSSNRLKNHRFFFKKRSQYLVQPVDHPEVSYNIIGSSQMPNPLSAKTIWTVHSESTNDYIDVMFPFPCRIKQIQMDFECDRGSSFDGKFELTFMTIDEGSLLQKHYARSTTTLNLSGVKRNALGHVVAFQDNIKTVEATVEMQTQHGYGYRVVEAHPQHGYGVGVTQSWSWRVLIGAPKPSHSYGYGSNPVQLTPRKLKAVRFSVCQPPSPTLF